MRWRAALAAAALLACGTGASATEIGLSAVSPVSQTGRLSTASQDYMQLFTPNAPWKQAAGRVNMFMISTRFAMKGSEADLKQIIADLSRRDIALSVSGLMLRGRPARTCGKGVEGYASPGWLAAALKRLKRLGADVRYVGMDEPLWYGHVAKKGCREEIEEVARQVAVTVAEARQVYPHIQIGDAEPIATGPRVPQDWAQQIARWTSAYRDATGEKLAFFDLDVNWQSDWKPIMRTVSDQLRASGIAVGIFYNGDPRDDSDKAWTDHAEQHFREVEADPALVPQRALFATWMKYPQHLLPEDQPGTLTYLVNRYAAYQSARRPR